MSTKTKRIGLAVLMFIGAHYISTQIQWTLVIVAAYLELRRLNSESTSC